MRFAPPGERPESSTYILHFPRKKNVYRIFVRETEGKKQLGRTRRRWMDNIKVDLREKEQGDVDWIDLDQGRD
jgi:hypothetical protein